MQEQAHPWKIGSDVCAPASPMNEHTFSTWCTALDQKAILLKLGILELLEPRAMLKQGSLSACFHKMGSKAAQVNNANTELAPSDESVMLMRCR